MRGFGKYLNTLGHQSFLPTLPKVKSDYIPYIFSDEEIVSIFHYADNLTPQNPRSCSSFFQLKIPMALRILYSCGTRLQETMSLQRKDVDFKNRTLFLKKTKFSKERVIPVHESLIAVMERYCLTLGIMHEPEAFLFPGRKEGSHYTTRQMDSWFSEILKLADIDQRERDCHERGACLHCFRHLFVLKSMQQLEAAGVRVVVSDAQDIEGTYTAISMIGELVGRQAEAASIVESMQKTFDEIKANAGDGTKTVYFEVSPLQYGLWTAGSGTFMDEIANMLGLTNCFADVTGWGEISEEQVLERNPDYIVTISMYYGEGPTPEEEILSRTGWENVTAVKDGKILNLPNNELSRPAPRLADGAKALYDFVYGE